MDEALWLHMLKDRNDLTHIYNENRAKELVKTIIKEYIPEFETLRRGLQTRYGDELENF